jgi:hypothetical protein
MAAKHVTKSLPGVAPGLYVFVVGAAFGGALGLFVGLVLGLEAR